MGKLRDIASGGVFDGAELSLAQLSEEAAPAIFDLCRCARAHAAAVIARAAAPVPAASHPVPLLDPCLTAATTPSPTLSGSPKRARPPARLPPRAELCRRGAA